MTQPLTQNLNLIVPDQGALTKLVLDIMTNKSMVPTVLTTLINRVTRMPPTWGQELEIDRWNFKNKVFAEVTEILFDGGEDGSGPWEFKIGPYRVNDGVVAVRAMDLLNDNVDMEPQKEMGNHIHIRPGSLQNVDSWASTLKTLYAYVLIYWKLLASHYLRKGYGLRETWRDWAEFTVYWYNLTNDRYELVERLRGHRGRYYDFITFNRNRKRTLTIEIRAAETWPIRAWTFVTLVMHTVRKHPDMVADVDLNKIEDLYIGFADMGQDINKKVEVKRLMKLKVKLDKDVYTWKELALKIASELEIPSLARKVLKYVYADNEANIVTNTEWEDFKRYCLGGDR